MYSFQDLHSIFLVFGDEIDREAYQEFGCQGERRSGQSRPIHQCNCRCPVPMAIKQCADDAPIDDSWKCLILAVQASGRLEAPIHAKAVQS